ncbi:phosphotransferase family protein [Sphingomonas sp. CGMCC 1.13654]|uniref:Phosphotransferase family protein n=1 Tax=Sphingomonas chungangi TaxID=2683589 RepID=A0A838L925_9SPHN|nr:phosphotransferase family protein [Sphingomonas chungangi]MBA2935527.1 phosphotransferase family protein [Sphingomonas chungangi]MVW57034.1 phosphotransferase [Sphingomonas chungangi]
MASLVSSAARTVGSPWDLDDMEPRVREILDRKLILRRQGPYVAKSDDQVEAILSRLYRSQGLTGVEITHLDRMAGGASKEQFAFTLRHDGDPAGARLVLRMDPLESIAQTCRGREAQVQRAMLGVVPVPEVVFCDQEGVTLGQPGLITRFVTGVTKPTEVSAQGVSGIGLRFDLWADTLGRQFVENLALIHGFDWANADLSLYVAPAADTHQAALHQVNWWSHVWRHDVIEPVPVVTLAERWLRENAPVTERPVLVHADYRIGNFMFEEPSGRFTAVLDWELSHIGDHHEDLAWSMQRLFGTFREDGAFLVSGLLPRDEFISQYEAASGNVVDLETLRYFEILNAYKCAVLDLGSGLRAAAESNNHQDLVLSWLGSAGAVFLAQIVKLIRDAEAARATRN